MSIKIPYKPPAFKETAFNCPNCNAFAEQTWHPVNIYRGGITSWGNLIVCLCSRCETNSIWYKGKMIYPIFSGVEPPNHDLNKGIKEDYLEAVSIVQSSPRGAVALLRLAIQKLVKQLGEKGKDLNQDIKNLVKNKNLPLKIQQSLDIVRVIGNEAVHPGQIDLKDDIKTANALFELVNLIAERMITEPKEIEVLYAKLPDNKKKEIEKRDKK